MTWTSMGRGALASVVSLALGLGATACTRDYTVAYVYATAATNSAGAAQAGAVNAYRVDYQSGALTQLADSPIGSGGRNPTYLTASPSGKFLYVLNHDDSTVVTFAVGTDGKLYPQQTVNVLGSFPTSATTDAAGAYLYVTSTYQPGFSNASPGAGLVTIWPINTDGTLNDGSKSSVNVGHAPVAITAGHLSPLVYVVDQESSASATGASAAAGVILGFLETQTTGALTPITTNTTLLGGYRAGTVPSSISIEATTRFVYVTDEISNQLIAYAVQADGSLIPLVNSTSATSSFPINVITDPRGKYLYVTNLNAGNVQAFAINGASGTLSATATGTGIQVGTNPTCAAIEPALGIYLYTSNNANQSISALQLDPHTGALKDVQNTPFPASTLPTCVVAVGNGEHATQLVQQ